MYPPYWLSSKEGTYHSCLLIFLYASFQRLLILKEASGKVLSNLLAGPKQRKEASRPNNIYHKIYY